MKRFLAIAVSSLFVFSGCASGPEFGEVSSAIQDSQEMQAEVEPERPQEEGDYSEGSDSQAAEAESPPTFEFSSEIVEDDVCKLREDSYPRNTFENSLASSFPAASGMSLPFTGTLNVKVVFIEWDDLRGTQEDYDYNLWSADMFSEFYRVMSEGKLNLKISSEPDWLSVGSSWEDDVIPAGMEGGNWQSREYLQPFIDQIVAAVDDSVDFTGVDVILFGTPSAEIVVDSLHIFSHSGVYAKTNEGTVVEMFSLGERIYEHRDSHPGWVQFSHEFGHSIGMPDLVDSRQGQNNIPMHLISPMYGHEIMGNQNAGSRSISGWIKWVQGWLDDSQVTCVEASDIQKDYYKLNPANIVGAENELVTVKLSDTKLLAIESTRWDSRFDLRTNHDVNGVIVYTVDSTLGHHEGPLRLLSPRDITQYLSDDHIWPDWRVLDVILFEGDSVSFDGITVHVERLSDDGDVVLITNSRS